MQESQDRLPSPTPPLEDEHRQSCKRFRTPSLVDCFGEEGVKRLREMELYGRGENPNQISLNVIQNERNDDPTVNYLVQPETDMQGLLPIAQIRGVKGKTRKEGKMFRKLPALGLPVN
jgi:hypothetical protein